MSKKYETIVEENGDLVLRRRKKCLIPRENRKYYMRTRDRIVYDPNAGVYCERKIQRKGTCENLIYCICYEWKPSLATIHKQRPYTKSV